MQSADLTLDPSSHEVFRGNKPIPLTKAEYSLLKFLLRNAGRFAPEHDYRGRLGLA
jgi:two-component system response regulator MprA